MALNDRQLRAAQLIAEGMNYTDVAEHLSTTYTTVYRWRQKPEFIVAIEKFSKTASQVDHPHEQAIDLQVQALEAYRRGRMDGLVLGALDTLQKVMTTGTSEQARVTAAKYVLEKFSGQVLGEPEQNSGLEELKSMLRLVGE